MAFGINELNARYNAIIKDYLSKGFEISFLTLGRTFSRVFKHIDVIDPKNRKYVYRVWMLEGRECLDSTRYAYADTINIRVKKYSNDTDQKRALQPEYGELISEKVIYVVKSEKAFTDDFDEMKSIELKHYERYRAKQNDNINDSRLLPIEKLPENFIDSIMERINRVRGFKRASATCIKSVCLFKESRYSYLRQKRERVLKGQVHYSFNGRSGYIYLG